MDFILNGAAHGSVAAALMQSNFDMRRLRPWIGKDGRSYVASNGEGGKQIAVPVNNAVATLRKDEWIQLDEAIVKAAKPRLRAVADLRGSGLVYTVPGGMARTVLQTETQSDINEAILSMDGLRESEGDRPVFNLENLPLPIIHKDFHFSARQVMASRAGGSPLDTTTAELAARRVAELAEQMLLGTASSYAYAGGTIYGYLTHPSANTQDVTDPDSTGWVASTTVSEVLAMKAKSQDDYHYGPWMLYCSTAWDRYMDNDYSANKGDLTLRERLRRIEGITDVRTLDNVSGFKLILVQMTSDVVREVMGMDITTLQWETNGGMQLHFKVMAIMVPQLRADYNGNMGLVIGADS